MCVIFFFVFISTLNHNIYRTYCTFEIVQKKGINWGSHTSGFILYDFHNIKADGCVHTHVCVYLLMIILLRKEETKKGETIHSTSFSIIALRLRISQQSILLRKMNKKKIEKNIILISFFIFLICLKLIISFMYFVVRVSKKFESAFSILCLNEMF